MNQSRSMKHVLSVMLSAVLTVPLLTASPSLLAWGPSALYPTPMDPLMPSPERAQQLRLEIPRVLETLRQAHRQSASQEWTGVPAQEGGAGSPPKRNPPPSLSEPSRQ